jgi:MFS family permease
MRSAHTRSGSAVTLAVVSISVGSYAMLQSLIVPVLTEIRAEYGASQTTATWVLTAYLVSAAVSTPLVGRIGDLYGKRRTLIFTAGMLSFGSVIGALAPSIEWMIAGRAIQGVGGGLLPLAFGMVRDVFPDRVASILGVVASLASVGFAVGFIAGGPISNTFGLDWLFWFPAIATASVVALGPLIPRSPVAPTRGRLPWVPALALSAWLIAILVLLSEGAMWGWSSPQAVSLFVFVPMAIAIWIFLEWRAPVPMVDMRMMRIRGVWTSNVVAAFTGFGMFACFGFLPQFIQTPPEAGYGLGATVTEAGRILVPWAICSAIGGAGSTVLARRIGYRTVVIIGVLLGATAFASIATFHDHAWQLALGAALQGSGSGLAFSSINAVVVVSVDGAVTSIASAMNVNIRLLGGAIGSAVMAGVVSAHLGATGFPEEAGYITGFYLLSVSMLVAAIAAAWVPRLRPAPASRRTGRAVDRSKAGPVALEPLKPLAALDPNLVECDSAAELRTKP